MFQFLRNLLSQKGGQEAAGDEEPSFGPHDTDPVATAGIMDRANEGPRATAGSWECEELQPEYDAFCATFCVRPGIPFRDVVAADDQLVRLKEWLHWSTREAEPKAILRLMLRLIQDGQNVWEQPGISIFLEGRWSQGGGPSPASDEALALLARTLQKPIKLYFQKKPGDPTWVNRYEP